MQKSIKLSPGRFGRFSKAFDKVNHLKLLFKLSTRGIKGKTLEWISSFLGGPLHPTYGIRELTNVYLTACRCGPSRVVSICVQ